MKNLTKFTILVIALSSMLTACKAIDSHVSKITITRIETPIKEAENTNMETKILWVAPYRKSCVGVASMQCLMIQETTTEVGEPTAEEWQAFYQDIEGFNWQKGKLSKIKVALIPVNSQNIQADGSSVRYKLIEVLQ